VEAAGLVALPQQTPQVAAALAFLALAETLLAQLRELLVQMVALLVGLVLLLGHRQI
jgi:hypothetical protein